MSRRKITEPALNQVLGEVLASRNPEWENILSSEKTGIMEEAGRRPDIFIDCKNPVAVETEFFPARTVEKDAKERLGNALYETGVRIEQAIAVRVPKELQGQATGNLSAVIQKSVFEFASFTDSEGRIERYPKTGWISGSVDDLARLIELSSLSERALTDSLTIMQDKVRQAAALLERDVQNYPEPTQKIAETLFQEDGEQTRRMAMAILINAMVFHKIIAGSKHGKADGIKGLDELVNKDGSVNRRLLVTEWKRILSEINYWPIFDLACKVLQPIRNGTAKSVLKTLREATDKLSALGITATHDLAGRMFQRLISDRKFLATFYTLPESAAMLAELAVQRLEHDWTTPDYSHLKIADLACGTGTLISAAYQAAISRMRRNGLDDREMHRNMMEKSLIGADIMPAATHLTASQLASAHPTRIFENTNIYTLPYGKQSKKRGEEIAIGALNLIGTEQSQSLFDTGRTQLQGMGEAKESAGAEIPHESVDLIIMNPPFTRPTNHEGNKSNVPIPSFAGFDTKTDEQEQMSRRLKTIYKNLKQPAGHGNAGLASNFIDLADRKVKPGGVIAFVLPASFVQGKSWLSARKMLAENYKNIAVISIATDGTTNGAFSADTGMAEVLLIANKRSNRNEDTEQPLFVNLYQRPETIIEGYLLATAIGAVSDDSGGNINIGSDTVVGIYTRGSILDEGGLAQVRNWSVVNTCTKLSKGIISLPRMTDELQVPITQLKNIGNRGLVHRDISGDRPTPDAPPRGPFDIIEITGNSPSYPALWAHTAERERQLIATPDREGKPRSGCDDRANEVWKKTASRMHFNLDFRLNSQSLVVCLTKDKTIGGRAWPNFLLNKEAHEKPLALWANTTLGLFLFWWKGARQHPGRSILTISALPDLPALDTRKLNKKQIKYAAVLFDEFKERKFLPANEAYRDETRKDLDKAVLSGLLGLNWKKIEDSLSLLRKQWCEEPTVHGGKSTRPNSSD